MFLREIERAERAVSPPSKQAIDLLRYYPVQPTQRRPEPPRRPATGACEHCGATFPRRQAGTWRRFCSARCRAAAHRAAAPRQPTGPSHDEAAPRPDQSRHRDRTLRALRRTIRTTCPRPTPALLQHPMPRRGASVSEPLTSPSGSRRALVAGRQIGRAEQLLGRVMPTQNNRPDAGRATWGQAVRLGH